MGYAQNREDEIVLAYFKGRSGILLEIGANDGSTLSNSKLLIENGWGAVLIEPSSAFHILEKLHVENEDVICHKVAVGSKRGDIVFWESGAHVPGGSDLALVSTTCEEELTRWPNVKFEKKNIPMVTFDDLRKLTINDYMFISIDIEGLDWEVLKQIDLLEVGCECLCIEWNGNTVLAALFAAYCSQFGFKEIHRNLENIIFAL